jgi:hypothetical protein
MRSLLFELAELRSMARSDKQSGPIKALFQKIRSDLNVRERF